MSYFYTNVSRYGNNICIRGFKDGYRFEKKERFSPTLYFPHDAGTAYALDGARVAPRTFDTMAEVKDYLNQWEGVSGRDGRVYGNTNYVSQYIQEQWPYDIEFDRARINVTTVDIEVGYDENRGYSSTRETFNPITAITMKNNVDDTFYVWACGSYSTNKGVESHRTQYFNCHDERELLIKFLTHWSSPVHCPDVVTGWNSRFFDIPYIVNRVARILGDDYVKKLSPWGSVQEREVVTRTGAKDITFELAGITQLDYMELFKKFAYSYGTQESYRLDHIAREVLGENKLEYEGTLQQLYEQDFQKFIDYNIVDVALVDRLEDKLGLITLAMTMAYKGGVNYADTLGTTAIWDSIIYRELAKNGIVIPPSERKATADYPGGYVKDVQVGLHDWVVSFDLNSLYPSIMVQWNMSPETIIGVKPDVTVDQCLAKNVTVDDETCLAANGSMFRTDEQGVLPRIIVGLYDERKQMKKKMLEAQQRLETIDKSDKKLKYDVERDIARYENSQMSAKILLNSLYGAMGNQYFRYFDLRIAEAITLTGQMVIKWSESSINGFMNKVVGSKNHDYIIAMDTDSVYANMSAVVEKYFPNKTTAEKVKTLDDICRHQIEPLLRSTFDDLNTTFKCYTNRMEMKREGISDRGIWIAKKHYILNVHNNEGVQYAEPKLKIMGIAAVKSSTPAVCRDALKQAFKVIMTGSQKTTQKTIADFRAHFVSLPAHQVAFPRGVKDLDKWTDKKDIYKKGTPIHVRGSLLFNDYLGKLGLQKQYEPIKSGAKIKFCYLKVPNPLRENVVAFPDVLPAEFKLDKYVDKDEQFAKTYISVIEPILEAIGWSVEERVSVEDFFG
jgi:DNA polymerase elongation subunit (family B)